MEPWTKGRLVWRKGQVRALAGKHDAASGSQGLRQSWGQTQQAQSRPSLVSNPIVGLLPGLKGHRNVVAASAFRVIRSLWPEPGAEGGLQASPGAIGKQVCVPAVEQAAD